MIKRNFKYGHPSLKGSRPLVYIDKPYSNSVQNATTVRNDRLVFININLNSAETTKVARKFI